MKLTERLRDAAGWDDIIPMEKRLFAEAADRIEMLEQIETNLCELHNIALADNEKLEAALAVAKDALSASEPDWSHSVQAMCYEALAKINEVMGVE